MWDLWLQWQEDAALDSEIERLIMQRKSELITIYCLEWQVARQHLTLAETRAMLNKVKVKYHSIDAELAKIDGRFSIVEMVKSEMKRDSQVKNLLKGMSKSERTALIDELRSIK